MTFRSLARAVAMTAAATTAATATGLTAATPAGADSLSNSVSTAGASGIYRLDATCHFGPVHPDNFEDTMVVNGVATAPGAISTTVRCSWVDWFGNESEVASATANAPAAHAFADVPHWRGAVRFCVSAEATYGRVVVVVAPKVCA